MDKDLYNQLLKLTFDHFTPLWETPWVSLEGVERIASTFAETRVPKGTYLPDLALQIAFDVIALSNNERIIRETFGLAPGEFVKVAVGHTFLGEDGEEDEDVSENFFFVEGEGADFREKIDRQLDLLGLLIGESLSFIETLETQPA